MADGSGGGDVRCAFLDTLDHFPSELLRQLWLAQALDVRVQVHADSSVTVPVQMQMQMQMLRRQGRVMQALVQEQRDRLLLLGSQLQRQLKVRARSRVTKPPVRNKAATKPVSLLPQAVPLRAKNQHEELYCFCHQPSYGDMIACENEKCPQQWFHYPCVRIKKAPKGHWFCSNKCKKCFYNLKTK